MGIPYTWPSRSTLSVALWGTVKHTANIIVNTSSSLQLYALESLTSGDISGSETIFVWLYVVEFSHISSTSCVHGIVLMSLVTVNVGGYHIYLHKMRKS